MNEKKIKGRRLREEPEEDFERYEKEIQRGTKRIFRERGKDSESNDKIIQR
jgi:hypothetical protein